MTRLALVFALAALAVTLPFAPVAPAADATVGDFTLDDPRGESSVTLSKLKDRKAVVVVFLGTECPVNNAFLPELNRLSKEYSPKGVQFLGVNANVQDTPRRVAEHAKV